MDLDKFLNHPKLKKFKDPKCFSSFGLAASLLVVLTFYLAHIDYFNQNQQPYSILNHFVSELGWYKVSDRAYIFSIGLFLGGILLLPFSYGFGHQFHGKFSKVTTLSLLLTGFGCLLVGLFPMDILLLHGLGAGTFFSSAYLATALLGILAFYKRINHVPRFYAFFSASILLILCLHITIDPIKDIKPYLHDIPGDLKILNRPDFWLLPFLEWCSVLSFLLYVTIISLTYLFTSNKSQEPLNLAAPQKINQ